MIKIAKLRHQLSRIITNWVGWTTQRRIVVIESDDWGSIRMPSREVYRKCLQNGYPVDQIAYEKYDSLASEEDLELLFDVLTSFKDKNGNHPVITANCVVANPDFDRIEHDNFTRYHYELITQTFARYPKHSKCFSLWLEGLSQKIFHPQFHAREHLNVSLLMDALRNGDPEALFGFENKMPGCISRGHELEGNIYIEATNYSSQADKEEKLDAIIEGLDIFETLFGYKSESLIPTNYIWSSDFNKDVMQKGVRYFQGIRKIMEPQPEGKPFYIDHYLGELNELGQTYLIRNALFEPSLFDLKIQDPVDNCMSAINVAFKMRRPAIISSHRLNYVGFIDENNRDTNLVHLRNLLHAIVKRWPDVEFFTSVQLGRLIT